MSTFKPQYKDKNGVVRDLNIDYNSLANKPTIGNGTLTIQKNGSNVATFGANSTSNVTANITVPTTLDDINDGSTRKLANYLALSGGTMTGNISYKGTQATYSMIKWIDNTADTYGNGIRIGGGGAIIIGGGESADLPSVSGGDEILYLMNDGNIDFYSNCQNGLDSAKHMSFDTSGNLNVPDVRVSGNIYEGGTLLSSKYAAASHNHDNTYLGKTTYEWNKEFAAGSNGAVSLGRYNIYDTQLTFDITTTTAITLSGKLVIASQNGKIIKATIYGDASNTLVNYLTIYQSAITNNRSWIEIFCNFPSWSKNKVHIYGVSLNSATVTRQMTSVTFTNGVPSGVTSGDTKWAGTIVNDITTYCAAKNHNHDSAYLGKTAKAADSNKLNGQEASYYAKQANVVDLSSEQTINGIKNFTGDHTKIDRLLLGTKGDDPLPKIEVYTQRLAATYNLALPDKNTGSYTLATTDDLSNYQPLDADLTSIASLSGTSGLLKKTAANTWSLDTNSYLPLSGGTLTGDLGFKSNYLIKPVADFRTSSEKHNGAITITLPAGIANTMVSMWIDVYHYVTNTSFSVHVGGYTYNNSSWVHQPFAMVYGANHTIRLGHNGTNFVIYIGETNSIWDYPQISVRNVMLGYYPAYDNWKKDWAISFSTSFSNVTATINHYAWTTKNFTPPTSLPASDVYAWAKAANKPTYTKSEVGLGNVDNTADANKSVNYANSAGSVAWANVSGKPTIPTADSVTTASKKTSSAQSTSKLFLIGATSQSADASTTYSNSKCYVGTDNCLYSNSTKVLTSHAYRPIQMNGSSILTSDSSTALNLKAGTNISLSNSNGTVTINSTASGGGMTSSKIFEGAGDSSGYYTTTLTSGNYKMLLFEINVSDYDFYLVVPTDYIKTASQSFHFTVGNVYNGGMGIVAVTASNTNFSASVSSGNIIIYNANVYAYK